MYMSSLKTTEKKILEKLFNMEGGYVLTFTDKSFEKFFKDDFGISPYDEMYDLDFPSKSKANRLRGIWSVEDDAKVGGIILALTDCVETDILTSGKEMSAIEKDLASKARDIGIRLLFTEIADGSTKPEVQGMKAKAELIKSFNAVDFKEMEPNKRIYLLKVLFSYYDAIIRAYRGSGLFFLTSGIDDLSDYFKVLRKRMIELLNTYDTFVELKKSPTYTDFIEPVTSLYASRDYLEVVWEESVLPMLINFREEIADKDLFENHSEVHKVHVEVVNFLDAISKEVEVLNGYVNQQTKKFYEEDLPAEKEKLSNIFPSEELYIKKQGDDFQYKGKRMDLSVKSDYYKVFCALYALLPKGGEVEYKDLITEIKSRVPKTKTKTTEAMRKFIQSNLTEKGNGFMRYSKLPATMDNQRPIIETVRDFGIRFNNKVG
jgi:hypothetical protein